MPKTTEIETPETETPETVQISDRASDQSLPYVGQWNQLISTTNWEKGQIICQWRMSLQEGEAKPGEYSDEAWSQLVGGVTPQHVGRLRRTFERFGHVYGEYEGVYWSHFYASLEWDDPEMWLEGAVQNRWSVSKMRQHRWETLGKIPEDEPQPEQIVSSELDEETQSLDLSEAKRQNDRDYIEGPVHEGPDFGDEDRPQRDREEPDSFPEAKSEAVRPFESFTDLPDDVLEICNAFKVAIIRHKADNWTEISQADMIGLLDALKQLAQIPAE